MAGRPNVLRRPTIRALTLGTVALAAVVLVALAGSRIAYPYDVGQYEANAWAPGSLITHFNNPYSESRAVQPPFVAAPYGPIHYAVVGAGLRLFGEQFWFDRLVSLAAALMSAWLIYRISIRFASERFTATLAAGLFLAQYPILSWAGVQRPDVLALAFVLAGFDLALHRRDGHRPAGHPELSALALVAAALTRQTYVIPIVIVALWYALNRDMRALARFGVTVCAVGGALLIALSTTSHGGFFTNLVTNQGHAKSSISLLSSKFTSLAEAPVSWLTAILLAFAAVAAVRRAPRDIDGPDPIGRARLMRLLALYVCLATVLAAAGASRAGSNINYFIEPLAAASLLVGLAGTSAVRLTSDARRAVALVVICMSVAVMGAREGHGELLRWQAKPYFAEVVSDLAKVPAKAGPMYSVYPELVEKAGRTSYVNDFVQYDGRSPKLKDALDRLIASKHLAAIVTQNPQAPPGYEPVPLRTPVPSGVYFVYPYVKRGLLN